MKKQINKRSQTGLSLIETMIVLALIGTAVGLALVYQSRAQAAQQAIATVSALTNMAGKVRTFYAPTGSYTGISGSVINGMSLVNQPLTWNATATSVMDPWGNAMTFVGNAVGATPTYVITIGGTTSPLDKEVCNTIATAMVSGADAVNIGASASITTTAGVAGGGSAYKLAGGIPNASNLSVGCQAENPVIALQFH
jgi:type II secretory pathway pseudopilin PulG